MKRFLIATCFILLLIYPFSAMSAGPENMFVWDDFNYFFSHPHTWTGTQTYQTTTGVSTYQQTLNTPSLNSDASGVTGLGGPDGGVTVHPTTKLYLPQQNNATTPTIAFGDSGFYESSPNELGISLAGIRRWRITASYLGGVDTGRPSFLHSDSTSTVPNVLSDAGDTSTGIGAAGTYQLSMICKGQEMARFDGTTTSGASMQVMGTFLANETLGGVSTFVITGNLTITDPLMLSGRPIEINATSSPYIDLPALALSSVTPQIIFQDVTKTGNDSGVTIRSTANHIHSGIGTTYTSGGTIFCNTGNTGFMLVLKALNYGSGVTPSWRVVSFSGNTLRRP